MGDVTPDDDPAYSKDGKPRLSADEADRRRTIDLVRAERGEPERRSFRRPRRSGSSDGSAAPGVDPA